MGKTLLDPVLMREMAEDRNHTAELVWSKHLRGLQNHDWILCTDWLV